MKTTYFKRLQWQKMMLGSGLASALILPATLSVSCGSSSDVTQYRLLPTYTGQADILIALNIKPDYYPLQLEATAPYQYLSNAESMMRGQSATFKTKLGNKLRAMIPSNRGPSWWNQFALASGEKGSDPEYWSHIGGDVVLYERYLLDDGEKKINGETAPRHYNTPETFIQTNFRSSRDPFTRIPEPIMHAIGSKEDYDKLLTDYPVLGASMQEMVRTMLDAARAAEGTNPDGGLAPDGKLWPSGKPLNALSNENSWIYNDYFFAKFWHDHFLDNEAFNASGFKSWFLDTTKTWIFSSKPSEELALRKLFYASTYTAEEAKLKAISTSVNLASPASTALKQRSAERVNINFHHPIYEQQEDIGSAPMFEGAMRDNMLYLYNIALALNSAFNPGSSAALTSGQALVQKLFASDARLSTLRAALANAETIGAQLRARMASIKVIVDKLANPVFGLVTIAPGAGSSTIQTASKFSFLYREMGFSQPMPAALAAWGAEPEKHAAKTGQPFNMDDNGWWWNLSGKDQLVQNDTIKEFEQQFDLGVLTVRDAQWASMKDVDANSIASMWKTSASVSSRSALGAQIVDYDLWNEGLKSPLGMHMLLDQVVSQLQARYGAAINASDLAAAQDWGSYFTVDFVK